MIDDLLHGILLQFKHKTLLFKAKIENYSEIAILSKKWETPSTYVLSTYTPAYSLRFEPLRIIPLRNMLLAFWVSGVPPFQNTNPAFTEMER